MIADHTKVTENIGETITIVDKSAHILLKRNTDEKFSNDNVSLMDGEIALIMTEDDNVYTGIYKVGPGEYNNLPYFYSYKEDSILYNQDGYNCLNDIIEELISNNYRMCGELLDATFRIKDLETALSRTNDKLINLRNTCLAGYTLLAIVSILLGILALAPIL